MPNRPVYQGTSFLARAAHAVIGTITGLGLLIVFVGAFQTQLPERLGGRPIISRVVCERQADPSDACRAAGLVAARKAVVAAR
jgi:hypothetical protein